MSTCVETEAAPRVEALDPERAAQLIARVEELRRLLREQREVLLGLLAEQCTDARR